MNYLELLAPAKDVAGGIKAINYGADAVYIGANRFSARQQAGNELAAIQELVRYAHAYRAKVYIALNTLLYDNEIEDARTLAFALYHIGVDALIVQDMAFLQMDLPPIPLHASTQANLTNLEKIQFFEQQGLERMILARELSLSEIAHIKANTNVELECFVHGSLCVCYSGQCYLSQYMGGRSANRGVCAQPCRLPYSLIDADGNTLVENKHLLSLKDMNRSQAIEELIDAGITSFKIEGRLKDETYIVNVVSYYRQLIDRFIAKNADYQRSSLGETEYGFTPDLEKSFNRGFTSYFLHGRTKNMSNIHTPKSMGKVLGIADRVQYDMFHLKTTETLINGDGLCWLNSNGFLEGMNVNFVENNWLKKIKGADIQVGTTIYRNYDHAFSLQLKNDKSVRKISCELTFSEDENGFVLKMLDEGNRQTELHYPCKKEIAKNAVLSAKNTTEQLSKDGESLFYVEKVCIETKNNYFIPLSLLNAMRRALFEKHKQSITDSYQRKNRDNKLISNKKIALSEAFPHTDFRLNVTNQLSKQFYEKQGVTVEEMLLEELNPSQSKTIFSSKYCLAFELGHCFRQQNSPNWKQPLYLQSNKHCFKITFDCASCKFSMEGVGDEKRCEGTKNEK